MSKHRLSPWTSTRLWALIIVGICLGCGPPQVAFSDMVPTSVDGGFEGGAQVLDSGANAEQDAARPGPADPYDAGPADAEPPRPPDPVAPPPAGVEDDAELVEAHFPSSINCGESAEARVTMRNIGDAIWTRDAGYKLGAVGDEDPFRAGRVYLSEEHRVEPGATHTFHLRLQAPEEAGSHLSDWRMVHEHVRWFGATTQHTIRVDCDEPVEPPAPQPARPLPDRRRVVEAVAGEHPDLMRAACHHDGPADWRFLNILVDRLRTEDTRWGYNWKRGVIGDASRDCVAYHWGDGTPENSPEVYIIDVIASCRGPNPQPAFTDQTEATRRAGTIGRWTSRGRF